MKKLSPSHLLLLAGLLVSAQAADVAPDAPNRELPTLDFFRAEKIDAALPKSATAVPKKARLVLICARTEGYFHESIPAGIHALEALGKATGAFKVEVNNEMTAFSAENLARFDAIIFLSSTQLKFNNPAHRQALLDFVHSGKGIVGIHAASDNFPTWQEGQALMGGVFHSHPWHAGDVVAVKLDEPLHPLNAAFGGKGFWIQDEIYQIVGAYGRDHQRELMSLDMDKPENQRPADQIVRKDGDFPIGWLKREGAGRVFYSGLGHNESTFFTPEVLKHFLDGIQFALGDLEADAVPSATLASKPAPALAPADRHVLVQATAITTALQPETLAAAVAYDSGADRSPLAKIDAAFRHGDADTRSALEAGLLKAVAAGKPSTEAKREIAVWLGFNGSVASISLLSGWATVPDTADDAVRALSEIPGAQADAALVSLLKNSPAQASVFSALAKRHVSTAIPEAVEVLTAGKSPAGGAALDYLSTLASLESGKALEKLSTASYNEGALWALVNVAGKLLPSEKAWSVAALHRVAGEAKTPTLKQAAWSEIARNGGEAGLLDTLPLLAGPDSTLALSFTAPWLRSATAHSSQESIAAVAKTFSTLSKPVQLRLLATAETLATPLVLPLADAGLANADADIVKAAIAVLGTSGRDASGIARLVELFSDPKLSTDAALALGRYQSSDVETRLHELAATTDVSKLAPLLTIAASRVDRAMMPFVLKAAASSGDSRKAAYKALASLVRGEDLDLLLSLRADLKTSQEKRAWQDAFFTAVRFRNDRDAVAAIIGTQLPKALPHERTTFVIALTLLDTASASELVRGELKAEDLERRKEIVRALSSARNLTAAALLADHMEAAKDANEVVLSLRGLSDTLTAFQEMNMQLKVKYYRRAWACARLPEDRSAILAIVERLWGPDAKKFAEELHAAPAKP